MPILLRPHHPIPRDIVFRSLPLHFDTGLAQRPSHGAQHFFALIITVKILRIVSEIAKNKQI